MALRWGVGSRQQEPFVKNFTSEALFRLLRHVQTNRGDAGAIQSEMFRSGRGDINDASLFEGAAIRNPHDAPALGSQIADPHPRPERQRAMRGGQFMLVVTLSASGLTTVKFAPIPGRFTGLIRLPSQERPRMRLILGLMTGTGNQPKKHPK